MYQVSEEHQERSNPYTKPLETRTAKSGERATFSSHRSRRWHRKSDQLFCFNIASSEPNMNICPICILYRKSNATPLRLSAHTCNTRDYSRNNGCPLKDHDTDGSGCPRTSHRMVASLSSMAVWTVLVSRNEIGSAAHTKNRINDPKELKKNLVYH